MQVRVSVESCSHLASGAVCWLSSPFTRIYSLQSIGISRPSKVCAALAVNAPKASVQERLASLSRSCQWSAPSTPFVIIGVAWPIAEAQARSAWSTSMEPDTSP
ncbi:hypothetical protein GCM10010384_59450 [Streptomyces djakartensis]|uniref:Uncharacterized protein n=1 Tax=Streptomyces djakartensis TaxID=68193 RepID=A0ABQ3ACD3_9ACTN|nr:hypothetical protein GCM10010384_59450 [Streptomyces djakartensis]